MKTNAFVLLVDGIRNNSGTDIDDSDLTRVRRKRRINIIESDPEVLQTEEVDNDTWINITGSDMTLQKNQGCKFLTLRDQYNFHVVFHR